MDQVKKVLGLIKQHHFWVLTVVVIGTIAGVWYTASTSLASQYKSNRSKIDSAFSSVNSLRSQPFKPNDDINQRQQKETQALAENVLREWETLYSIQKENVLIWPTEIGDRFVEAVQDDSFGDSIPTRLRELYLNYIKDTFPSLVKIVDAEVLAGEGGGGGRFRGGGRGGGFDGDAGAARRGGAPGEEPESEYMVDWLDQVELRDRLELDKIPTALHIWVLQEDLWVYRTLLEAIARTNDATGASRRERAAVQTIAEMKVGQAAAGFNPSEQRLDEPDTSGASISAGGFGGRGGFDGGGGFGEGDFGGFGGRGGGFDGGGRGGFSEMDGFGARGGGEGGDEGAVLLAGRYLDEAGAPISEVSEPYNFGTEFKRLPVRLVLEMDSRWLSQLMWELANAPLQVEIEQVRFNPGGTNAGSSRGGDPNGVEAFDRRPTSGTVVLQGIVYLFNKPDPSIAQFDPVQ